MIDIDDDITNGKIKLLEYFWKHSKDNLFIVRLDKDGDFVLEDVNPSQAKNFDFNFEKVKNQKLKDFLGEQVAKDFEKKYHECLENNMPQAKDEAVVVDGEEKHWHTMILPIIDTITGTQRVFGIARDLTELYNTKKELEKLNQELENTVKERTKELENANKKLQDYAFEDTLTKIGNRRYFFEHANSLLALSKRLRTNISLIYIDLDYFKLINDKYGHPVGDMVLSEFAALLKKEARESDILSRFGGEEFILLLPFTSMQSAIKIASRIQENIKNHTFIHKKEKIDLTLSIGIATYEKEFASIEELIEKADKALYKAKYTGRNRIELAV